MEALCYAWLYCVFEEDIDLQISSYKKYKELNKYKETLYLLDGKDSLSFKGPMWKLARAYYIDSQDKKAIQIAQEIIEIDPTYYTIYPAMIDAYRSIEQYDKAIFWAKKMLESMDSADKKVGYYSLANIAQKQGRTNEAITYYEMVLELNPNNADALNNLSNCCHYNPSYAIELKEKAAKFGNKNATKWLNEHGYIW